MTDVIVTPIADTIVTISNPANSSSDISASSPTSVTVVNPNSTTVSSATVSVVYPGANSVTVSGGVKGDTGAPGAPGASGGFFAFTQASPASTWTISHGLGYQPNVSVVDSAGSQVEGNVVWADLSTLFITFSGAFSGVAYLS
jgi:hypothetical protein